MDILLRKYGVIFTEFEVFTSAQVQYISHQFYWVKCPALFTMS